MIDFTYWVLSNNSRMIHYKETSFYSWLMTSDDNTNFISEAYAYLNTVYDFDLVDDAAVSLFCESVLRGIYNRVQSDKGLL